jgi:hypothetical protein
LAGRPASPTPSPIASQALVDQARAALQRLAEESPIGPVAYAAIDELDRRWDGAALTVGISGERAARTALLDGLAGGALEGIDRAPGCPTVRLVRSSVDRFRAHHADGTVEDRVRPRRRPTVDDELALVLRPNAEAARATLDDRVRAAGAAERAVPAVVRTRPPRWAVWAWLVRWILTWLKRDAIAAHRRAVAELAEAEHEHASADRIVVDAEACSAEARRRYPARLHEVCAAADLGIRNVELEVATGPLPEGVVVLELATDTVDAEIELDGDDVMVPRDEDGGAVRSIGGIADAAAVLPALAINGRARRIAGRAIDTIRIAIRSIDDMLDGVEADHRTRAARLAVLRLPDRATFVATRLDQIRPQINASLNAVMEHAQAHLGGGLALVAAGWAAAVTGAGSGDDLKTVIARIDETSAGEVSQLAEEVRLLVMGGVGGCAHDLHPVVLAPLAAHGLTEDQLRAPRAAPVVPSVAILPSLAAGEGTRLGKAGWFAKLFRSLESRRADVIARLRERETHLREIAHAELLHAEPQLHAALARTLAGQLAGAIDLQVAWLERELAREQAAIDGDRQALAPLAQIREVARDDLRHLTELSARLEP